MVLLPTPGPRLLEESVGEGFYTAGTHAALVVPGHMDHLSCHIYFFYLLTLLQQTDFEEGTT